MTYTKLSIIIKEKPPYFIGSQLRGALGYALKKVTCINPSYTCEGCFATSSCLFYEFYEEKNTFHKYRFDYELGLSYYNFDFYLFEVATAKLPYIVSAFHMLLTQVGLGSEHKTYKDFDMFINDKSCYVDKKIILPKETIKTFICDSYCPKIKIQFVTPLRIKKNNHFSKGDDLQLMDIINSIYQREQKLTTNEYQKLPFDVQGEIITKNLHFEELTRKSNRQQTLMSLGGIMGSMMIENLNKETYEVLKLGEMIGVGKQTVFGLGKIKVVDIG